MKPRYETEFKEKIARLHIEEKRTYKSLADEYSISVASILNWTKEFRLVCQANEEVNEGYDYIKENLRLRKELEVVKKENQSLKMTVAIFAKEID